MMRQLTAFVSGEFQMTGYRVLGRKGYVRNLPDGRVMIQAEGPLGELESSLKGRMVEQRTEGNVQEIKARMRP